jgi:hypothetical protein
LLKLDPDVRISGQGISVGDLKAIEKFLLKNDWVAEQATLDLLVRQLWIHDLDLDIDEEPRDSPAGSSRSNRLRRIVDAIRPTTRSSRRTEERQKEKERQKQLEEREAELGKREKQVVEALNVLAKERE